MVGWSSRISCRNPAGRCSPQPSAVVASVWQDAAVLKDGVLRCVLARLCLPASPVPILHRLSCSWPLGTWEACSGVSSLLHTFSWAEYFSSKNWKTFLFAVAGALHLEINWTFQSGTLFYGRLLDAHNFQEQRAKTLLFFFPTITLNQMLILA